MENGNRRGLGRSCEDAFKPSLLACWRLHKCWHRPKIFKRSLEARNRRLGIIGHKRLAGRRHDRLWLALMNRLSGERNVHVRYLVLVKLIRNCDQCDL